MRANLERSVGKCVRVWGRCVRVEDSRGGGNVENGEGKVWGVRENVG